jgi:hypothetical protein
MSRFPTNNQFNKLNKLIQNLFFINNNNMIQITSNNPINKFYSNKIISYLVLKSNKLKPNSNKIIYSQLQIYNIKFLINQL